MSTKRKLEDGDQVRVVTRNKNSLLNGLQGQVIDIEKRWSENPSVLVLFDTTPYGRELWFTEDELELESP